MKKISLLLFATLYGTLLLAQEDVKNIDVNINSDSDTWYASPWVWIAGAAVFILLMVALTRGRRD